MPAATHKLVRIKPSNKKESHASLGYTIRKTDGWCKIPIAVAEQLAKEKMNELNPDASAYIFDVMDVETAREIVEAEQARYEPAGTIDAPKEKLQAPEPDEPRRRSRAQANA